MRSWLRASLSLGLVHSVGQSGMTSRCRQTPGASSLPLPSAGVGGTFCRTRNGRDDGGEKGRGGGGGQ